MFKVRYATVDHCRGSRTFKTLAGARKFAVERVGEHPEFGRTYAVSADGVGKITVEGCTLAELFAGPAVEMVELHNDDCDAPIERAPKADCVRIAVDCDSDETGLHVHYGWFRKVDIERQRAEIEAIDATLEIPF